MMVHRLGRTILLDEFDVHSHLLRLEKVRSDLLRSLVTREIFSERMELVSRFLFGHRSAEHFGETFVQEEQNARRIDSKGSPGEISLSEVNRGDRSTRRKSFRLFQCRIASADSSESIGNRIHGDAFATNQRFGQRPSRRGEEGKQRHTSAHFALSTHRQLDVREYENVNWLRSADFRRRTTSGRQSSSQVKATAKL